MVLSEKSKKMKTEIKYKLKELLVSIVLNNLSNLERENIKKCVDSGVSFWTEGLGEFDNYLTILVLYDLLVKNQTYSYIHNSWSPDGILAEAARDAEVSSLNFPFKTHMYVYKDRIELNGAQYYNVTQDEQTNHNNRVSGTIKSRVKSLKEFSGLFNK